MYRQLDAQKIVDTACTLQSRISERFSGSGLSRLAAEVSAAARETLERSRWIRKPHLPLRIAIYVLLAAILGLFLALVASLEWPKLKQFGEFIQVLEAGLSAMFFISAFVIFLFTWESRIKRNRALKAIHELRAMAHIVDMHQLTKNPDAFFFVQNDTASSPKRTLSAFELGRYLDYCSELLSLIGKIAALYSHCLEDPVVLEAVDDVEDLTTELSQKIWQKITLLDTLKLQIDSPKPKG